MTAHAFRLGLTGSIGMGKSTTAGFFEAAGIPVWDADAAVHRLYKAGGAAGKVIAEHWPDAVGADGAVDRMILRKIIQVDPAALHRLEALVHPMVQKDRSFFLEQNTEDIVVLDIPLLFETGADADMDATLVVTAPIELQRARVMARAGMTSDQLAAILGRQLPDREKRARATHIIETLGFDAAKACVQALIAYIRSLRHA